MVPFTDPMYREKIGEAMDAAKSRLSSLLTEELRVDGANNITVMFKPKFFSTSEDGIWSQTDICCESPIGNGIVSVLLMMCADVY